MPSKKETASSKSNKSGKSKGKNSSLTLPESSKIPLSQEPSAAAGGDQTAGKQQQQTTVGTQQTTVGNHQAPGVEEKDLAKANDHAVTIAAEPGSGSEELDFRPPLASITEEMVALRAYHLWEQRGRQHGSATDDWNRAEAELRVLLRISSVTA